MAHEWLAATADKKSGGAVWKKKGNPMPHAKEMEEFMLESIWNDVEVRITGHGTGVHDFKQRGSRGSRTDSWHSDSE